MDACAHTPPGLLPGALTCQDVSIVCWAFAKCGLRNDALFKTLRDYLLTHAHQFDAQQISNTLWSCFTLCFLFGQARTGN